MSKRVRPSFMMKENSVSSFGDLKPGQKLNVVINARVIEQTKSFNVLRVEYLYLKPSKRTY